jgi:glycerol-3-phosphate dehydrogenase (NAD(P)+)
MAKISVIGSGTWGMALSLLLDKNGHEVKLWSALPNEVETLNSKKEHPNLPGVPIPDSIRITGDLEDCVRGAECMVLSVPSVFTRATAKKMRPYVAEGQIIVNVAKGIEEDTLMTLCEQIEEEIPQAKAAVLSGPSHAEEVGRGVPTTCVVGADEKAVADFIQSLFISPVFRVYTSPDVLGIELGGSLKNVIALAAGIADGLGYGDNTKAALITRGLAEMTRLAVKMGARPETLSGLSGMGDLIVTCASMHSRNRRAGILIGQGKTMQEAMDEVHMVVEGVYSAKAAKALSEKYQVRMPIVSKVNEVLFEGKSAAEAVDELMCRESGVENPLLPWD